MTRLVSTSVVGTHAGQRQLARILCVDDEPNVLAALSRILRIKFSVSVAPDAETALALIAREAPFAAVVSDLRMPTVDGASFLARVRDKSPSTVRLMLTGNPNLEAAIAAVNEGQVFRFLLKPYGPSQLVKAVEDAVEQHRLVNAEKELLEQTVQGSIKALTDLLAIMQPAAFGRATRLKRLVEALAIDLDLPDRWQVEVAALLSQVGYIILPSEISERMRLGIRLTSAEEDFLARLPRVPEQLVASIPRLEAVCAILQHQDAPVKASSGRETKSGRVPRGAQLLRIARDFDDLESEGKSVAAALEALERSPVHYDPVVLAALRRVCGVDQAPYAVDEIYLSDVRLGMVFATDVLGSNGLLLVARGQQVTPSLLERIHRLWHGFAGGLRVNMVRTRGEVPSWPDAAVA